MLKNFLKPLFTKNEKRQDDSHAFIKELEIDVLARTIYGEARSEPAPGMEAVACVVLNRVKIAHKMGGYWWGSTIIQVCQKPYQFSCWNKNDPNRETIENATEDDIHFATCLRIARRAVIGALRDTTNGATHYYADYIDEPYWAKDQKPVTKIGRHIFYRLIEV